MQHRTIRAIIFDLGRVIIPFDFQRAYQQFAAATSLSTEEVANRIAATGLMTQFESGLVDTEEFTGKIGEVLGLRIPEPEFQKIWKSIFLPETLIPAEMIVALKKRYRVLLLSNTNELHFSGLDEDYPILQEFEHQILSYKLRVMKPDLRIYQHAAEVAGCEPGECLFIDDLPENVEGAKKAGMQAIVFRCREELERDFEQFGIAVG